MFGRRFRSRLFYLVPMLGLSFMLLSRAGAGAGEPAKPPAHGGKVASTSRLEGATGSVVQEKVTIGCYLQNVSEVDVKSNTFKAEFYVWFMWNGAVDPTLSFQLTNGAALSEMTKTPIYTEPDGTPKPEVLPDGRNYQVFHVYGTFTHPFPLSKYPFDEHEIMISIQDARHPSNELVYEVDEKGSTTRPDLTIPGWRMNHMRSQVGHETFPTNFGDPRASEAKETYSQVDFLVHITRPVVGLLAKTVVPLAIILLITFLAFYLQPEDIDARLCLTITALISAVALQFTTSSELPPTGYLILLDKIYILSYASILVVTAFCVLANHYTHVEQRDSALKLDKVGLWLNVGGYFIALALILVLH